MTVIYEANENRPHFCTTADRDLPLGSICRCECGRFWLRKTVIGDYWVRSWVPVRWYHRQARKRIKAWERPGGETPVQTEDEAFRLYVEAQKARFRLLTDQAKEKVKDDSRKLYLTRAGADGEQEWREADDTTPTKFRVTANVYPSPFAEKTCAVATWTGTRFQIGEMAGEYADESDNPLLHMEIDTVEVLDE